MTPHERAVNEFLRFQPGIPQLGSYIKDMTPTWKKSFNQINTKNSLLIFARNNTFLQIEENIDTLLGYTPNYLINKKDSWILTHLLDKGDHVALLKETLLLLKTIMCLLDQKQLDQFCFRAKTKLVCRNSQSKWLVIDCYGHEVKKYGFLVNGFYDFSKIRKDNFHKFYWLDTVSKQVIYQNYYPGSEITQCGVTRREIQVLNLIAEGWYSQDIGDKLFIEKDTIDKHRKSLIRKFKAKNVSNLIKKACLFGAIMNNKEFIGSMGRVLTDQLFPDYHYYKDFEMLDHARKDLCLRYI